MLSGVCLDFYERKKTMLKLTTTLCMNILLLLTSLDINGESILPQKSHFFHITNLSQEPQKKLPIASAPEEPPRILIEQIRPIFEKYRSDLEKGLSV